MKNRHRQLQTLIATVMAMFILLSVNIDAAPERPMPVTLKYNLAGTGSWVPYGFFGDVDKPGIFAEVIAAILDRAGYSFEFYYYPPKRADKAFDEGLLDVDFMSSAWFKDGDIGDPYVASSTIFNLTEYIVTLPENAHCYVTPSSIHGQRVSTVAGYDYHDDDKFIRVDFFSEARLIKGLQMLRFRSVILEGVTAKHWSSHYDVPIALASVHSEGVVFLRLRKEFSDLLPSLNEAITALKNEGEIDRIFQKYAVK